MSQAHTVGIWRASDQTLLASVTVPAGTAGTLINGFRYLTLATTVPLTAGTNDVIGVEYPRSQAGADELYQCTQMPAPGITLSGNSLYAMSASTLTYPATIDSALRANAGFQFVPEPSTWALLGVGVAGLGLVLR